MSQESPTVAHVLALVRDSLRVAGSDTPELDAEVLLAHVLGHERAWLYAHPDYRLASSQLDTCASQVHRRTAREPIAYLLGHKEFFGLDFIVSPAVLVPRPETELLVEIALESALHKGATLTVADVGTGSGVIAVALAAYLPRAHLLAIDTSSDALAVARRNAARHGVAGRVMCVQADLLRPFDGAFDLIVSNPPYLCTDELRADVGPGTGVPQVETEIGGALSAAECGNPLAWEPRVALDGGGDGLAVIRRLLPLAAHELGSGGVLVMELGASQGQAVLSLAVPHFPGAAVEIVSDYAGMDRVLVVRRPRRRVS